MVYGNEDRKLCARSTVRFELMTEIFHAAAEVRMISFPNTPM